MSTLDKQIIWNSRKKQIQNQKKSKKKKHLPSIKGITGTQICVIGY